MLNLHTELVQSCLRGRFLLVLFGCIIGCISVLGRCSWPVLDWRENACEWSFG